MALWKSCSQTMGPVLAKTLRPYFIVVQKGSLRPLQIFPEPDFERAPIFEI